MSGVDLEPEMSATYVGAAYISFPQTFAPSHKAQVLI